MTRNLGCYFLNGVSTMQSSFEKEQNEEIKFSSIFGGRGRGERDE